MGWFSKDKPSDAAEQADLKEAGWLWKKYKERKARKEAERKQADDEEKDTEKAIREALGEDDDKEDA